MSYSILGLFLLAIDIAVIFEIMQSLRSLPNKVLWAFFILLCPLIGVICYLLLGDRRSYGYTLVQ